MDGRMDMSLFGPTASLLADNSALGPPCNRLDSVVDEGSVCCRSFVMMLPLLVPRPMPTFIAKGMPTCVLASIPAPCARACTRLCGWERGKGSERVCMLLLVTSCALSPKPI